MSETPSSSSQIEVTIKHRGDLSGYEAPVVSMTKGGIMHPLNCYCGCETSIGSGAGKADAD